MAVLVTASIKLANAVKQAEAAKQAADQRQNGAADGIRAQHASIELMWMGSTTLLPTEPMLGTCSVRCASAVQLISVQTTA